MYFVPCINLNHKDTMHPSGARLDKHHMLTKMWVRPAYLKFSKPGRCGDFCSKNPADSRVSKQVRPKLFLYYFSQYSCQEKFFWLLLIMGVVKTRKNNCQNQPWLGHLFFQLKNKHDRASIQIYSTVHSNKSFKSLQCC